MSQNPLSSSPSKTAPRPISHDSSSHPSPTNDSTLATSSSSPSSEPSNASSSSSSTSTSTSTSSPPTSTSPSPTSSSSSSSSSTSSSTTNTFSYSDQGWPIIQGNNSTTGGSNNIGTGEDGDGDPFEHGTTPRILHENFRPPSLHVLGRTDPSSLVSVATFASQAAALKKKRLWDAELDGLLLEVDIETPGRTYTAEGKIGQLINDAVVRFLPKLLELKSKQDFHPRELMNLLLSKITIPSIEDINRTFQSSKLESLSDPEAKKHVRKEVNYISPFLQPIPNNETAPVAADDVVLSVAVVQKDREGGQNKSQEFLVLGSQPLSLLKDVIYCLNNHTLGGASRKSGYFLFENTFYNDMREPENIDYSRYIIDWARENEIALDAQSKKMEQTLFRDLNISIGTPYLYVHQGECEHTLVFTEVRQIQPYDCQNVHAYPLQVFQSKIRRKKCQICDIYASRYITYNDRLAPSNPCSFCDNCYVDFHYGADGVILYDDFEVFPYYHS